MKKVILFARVSTQQQTLERQKELLFPLIMNDGYTEDDIAVIEYKESAIKNDVQNRKSISEMKELIKEENIEAVYVTEISRLGRRNDVLYKVLALLEEEHISLVVQSPMLIRTIEKDGTPNEMAHVVISFMQHLAVSEMQVKKDRQKSGYELSKKEGHLTVSRVKFGYARSKDNRPIINEDEAALVRKAFKMYLDGESIGIIADEIKYLANWHFKDPSNKIYSILEDKTYIGKNDHFPYPPIIDEETFNKASERLDSRRSNKYKTAFVYYCHHLIRYNGKMLTPSHGKHIYQDSEYNSININCIDGLTKCKALVAYTLIGDANDKKAKESLLEAKETASKKIVGITSEIDEMTPKLERLNEIYLEGRINKATYEFRYKKIQGEIEYLIKEKDKLNVTVKSMEDALACKDNKRYSIQRLNNLSNITDDKQIAKIINEVVERIDLEKIDNGWNIHYTFKDVAYNEREKGTYYQYIRRGNKIFLYECSDDNTYIDLTGTWEKRL